jgi:hypothetical protein
VDDDGASGASGGSWRERMRPRRGRTRPWCGRTRSRHGRTRPQRRRARPRCRRTRFRCGRDCLTWTDRTTPRTTPDAGGRGSGVPWRRRTRPRRGRPKPRCGRTAPGVGELNESVEVVNGVVAVALSNNGGSDVSLRRGPNVCCSQRGHTCLGRRDADVSPVDRLSASGSPCRCDGL